jgi:response regulator RpfG family c-di-GMP phosphodiesterase
VIPVSLTNRATQFTFGAVIAIALPRIPDVDDDHQILAAATDVLGATAHLTRVDSSKITQRELATAYPIDVAVLDISLGSESGLGLLPILHDRDAILAFAFSANVERQACNEQIKAILGRSDTSLENLPDTTRDRLVLLPATPIEEIA